MAEAHEAAEGKGRLELGAFVVTEELRDVRKTLTIDVYAARQTGFFKVIRKKVGEITADLLFPQDVGCLD